MNNDQKSAIINKIENAKQSLTTVQKKLELAKSELKESYVSNGTEYKNKMDELENVIVVIGRKLKKLDVLKDQIASTATTD